jgi:hypothetical protein
MDLIGDIIPMVNGACTNSTQTTLVRKLTFYVTTAREFFLLNTHGSHGSVDNTSKEYIKYDPNGYNCCDNNNYLELRSPVSFELDINWDDNSEIEHVVATKSGSFYYVRWYSYDSDYYRKYTGNGTDGQKDVLIPNWGFRNHIFQGTKKEHVVTMTFTKGYIDYIWAYYLNFGKYPLFEVPELTTIDTQECPCDVINTDRFLYCPNLTTLGLRSVISSKYDKYPNSLWQLTKLKNLYIDSFVSDRNADNNGIRNIVKLKNLVNLTMYNGVDRYIKEFNELPNIRYIKISQAGDKSNIKTIFSKDSITKINPNLYQLDPLSVSQDDTDTDMDIVTGTCFNEIEDLSHITVLPTFFQIPKGKKIIIPEWMDRTFNFKSLNWSKIFGQDRIDRKPTTIDLGIGSLYEHTKQFGYNQNYVDGPYKGKRNPWYNLKLTAYSQSQPVSYRPTGIYQEPTGFEKGVSDGNPASPMEMLYVLVNNYKWTCIIPPETPINTNPGETLKPTSISLATIEDEAINDNTLEYVEYNTDEKNEVDGRILLIKDSNVTDVIEGDLFNTSVLIPNDVDIISFKTEDEAKEYCNEEGYIYPSSK